ncbi:MAG: response regulator [Halieaceae bacterium]|nr:response regulator [Halieaceae bacterium]
MTTHVSRHLLLVEDNEVNREMLQRRLKRAGFTLDCAADGQEALDKMRTLRPALVLLDINLPVKDGWTVAKEASADPQIQDLPIIALTAHAMESDRQQALAAGCQDYATKPIDFPELLIKIEKLLTK